METKIVSFCHGKGGSGKSSLTNMAASFLTSIGISVFVADVDTGQGSLMDIRQMDVQDGGVDPNLFYKLAAIDPVDFPTIFANELDGEFEYVFIDFPGNLKQPGVISCIATVDYMFVPCGFDLFELAAFKKFVALYNEEVKPIRDNAGFETVFKGVWNRVFVNVAEYNERDQTAKQLEVEFLESVVPASFVTFGRNARTYGKMEYNTGKDYINNFLSEVCQLIGVKQKTTV